MISSIIVCILSNSNPCVILTCVCQQKLCQYSLVRHILCDIAQLLTSACQIGGLFEEGGVECQWQQFAGASLDEVYPLSTIEQGTDGLVVSVLDLEHHLSAGSTGRDGLLGKLTLGVGRYGQCHDGTVGVGSTGMEEGGALGTHPRRVGGILLIATCDHGTIAEPDGCTYLEVRVGCIAALGGMLGGIDELAILLFELFIAAEQVSAGVGDFFHYRVLYLCKSMKNFLI